MSVLVACDLDRTIIYSAKAFWLEAPDPLAPRIVVSEVYRGVPISFMTRASEDLLRELSARVTFVPVTTRTVAQYERVQLPGAVPAFAITSNGGVILVDGEPDAAWSTSVRTRLTDEAAPLAEVCALLEDHSSAAWITKVNNAENLFVYAIVDRELMPDSWLESLEARCLTLGWAVSVQGRKLYCVPHPVTKAGAVAEVRRRLGAPPSAALPTGAASPSAASPSAASPSAASPGAPLLIAAGDSLLDAGMLELADLAFRPAHGELHDAGFTCLNLTVTSARGILAGEELLRLIAAAAAVPL